jgi:hypothetical protein
MPGVSPRAACHAVRAGHHLDAVDAWELDVHQHEVGRQGGESRLVDRSIADDAMAVSRTKAGLRTGIPAVN